jgi:hypothetical protein
MTRDEAKPFTRHWVEVHMWTIKDGPSCRGVFLPGDGITFCVNGKDAHGAIRTTEPLRVSEIRQIVLLGDPPWLQHSNKFAAVHSADFLAALTRAREEGPRIQPQQANLE